MQDYKIGVYYLIVWYWCIIRFSTLKSMLEERYINNDESLTSMFCVDGM